MQRIKSIKLNNFRGYRTTDKALDLDADLILVTGKNGVGKTSLLYALDMYFHGRTKSVDQAQPLLNISQIEGSLTLDKIGTGVEEIPNKDWPEDPMERGELFSQASFFYQDRPCLDVASVMELLMASGSQSDATRAALKAATPSIKSRRSQFIPNRIDTEGMRRQSAAAFAEAIAQLAALDFPEATAFRHANIVIKGNNPANHWPSQVESLLSTVDRLAERPAQDFQDMAARLDALGEGLARLAERQAINHCESGRQSRLAGLRALVAALPEEVRPTPFYGPVTVADMRDREARYGLRELPLAMDEWGRARLAEELPQLDEDLAKQRHEYQQLRQAMEKLTGADNSLLAFLEDAAQSMPRWLEDKSLRSYDALQETFTWLDNLTGELPSRLDALRAWRRSHEPALEGMARDGARLVERNDRWRLGHDLSEALAGVTDTDAVLAINSQKALLAYLDSLLTDEGSKNSPLPQQLTTCARLAREWAKTERRIAEEETRLKHQGNFQDGLAVFDAAEKIIKREQGSDGLTSLMDLIPEEARQALLETLNRLLPRFHFPPEFLPIRIRDVRGPRVKSPTWNLLLGKDKQSMAASALSTGQRTQLALCWGVSLNYALRGQMKHHLMAFDDFTTALDMGQLIPAATLLRQLAYCESEEYRRQVIVTSHHEDLTNKLLDHLLPPPGRSMKVIEFTEWRADEGPEWNTYEVRMPLTSWPNQAELGQWLNAQR